MLLLPWCTVHSMVWNVLVNHKYVKGKAVQLQALRVPEGWGCHISRQSAHRGGKVVSPTHRPLLPPRKYSWYSVSFRGRVNPMATVRPERLCQWKNSDDTVGNRNRDLPACGAVRQPTAPRRTNILKFPWKYTYRETVVFFSIFY